MNANLKSALIFTAGVAVGVASTWRFLDKKYTSLAEKEIKSVKDSFARHNKKVADIAVETTENGIKHIIDTAEDIKDAAKKAAEKGNISEVVNDILKRNSYVGTEKEKAYRISSDEFGEFYDYEYISLLYNSVDDSFEDVYTREEVDNVEDIFGEEVLTLIRESTVDPVYARNDAKKCDYEIIKTADPGDA